MTNPSRKSKGNGGGHKKDEDIDIVPSGLALNVAAGWLGIKDVHAELEDDSKLNASKSKSVKQYGGLGYVGSKHRAALVGVEHRLGLKVYGSLRNRADGEKNGWSHSRQKSKGNMVSAGNLDGDHIKNTNDRSDKGENDSDSDSDEGRGAAFSKKRHLHGSAAHVILKGDLLSTSNKKKKKMKR